MNIVVQGSEKMVCGVMANDSFIITHLCADMLICCYRRAGCQSKRIFDQ
jgi:hypothetical protein